MSGVIKGSGIVKKTKAGKIVEIFTDLESLHKHINKIVEQYYGVSCSVETLQDYIALKIIRYKITIPAVVTTELLKDISVTELNERNEMVYTNGIDKNIINSECCKRAYIQGIFVANSTSNIVIKNYDNNAKNNSGYHLEFVFNNEKLGQDFMELLAEFNIVGKLTNRKGTPIVYIKEYQVICDVLALVGASVSVLNLQNEAAIRDVRNNVNRQLNCFNANLNKMVESSLRQLNAINYIQQTAGLESLDEPLYELAILRMANPDEPLENLRKLYSYDISKSGLNHRLEKIIKIANKLKDSMNNN